MNPAVTAPSAPLAPGERPKGGQGGDGSDGRSLLLFFQAPVYRDRDGALHVEAQAANGLRLWSTHFSTLVALAPEGSGPIPTGWVRWAAPGDVMLEVLPDAWRPDRLARHILPQSRRIGALIDVADYLVFSIGGPLGDWGAVAAWLAHRRRRGFAVWTDRVESDVMRRSAATGSLRHRLKARVNAPIMAAMERYVISRADLGLFHGAETYHAYAPRARQAVLAHNIHLSADERITDAELAARRARLRNCPLRIGYAGRVHWSKGWQDWLEVLSRLAARGVEVDATWLGNGPDLEQMRDLASARGGAASPALPGFEGDRARIRAALQGFDILLFCHKTRESPRILIEALMNGTPIVGYRDAYSADLISKAGGGRLVAPDDIDGLAHELARLSADRHALDALTVRAAEDGARFDDASVFAHRSDMVKRHVRPRGAPGLRR
ncbi:MAG: glycosyltransferase [Pseudomonadota bacterium]